ncbi:MAG: nucleotidyltransferase family protein [Bacteroidales bacterium]|nr:nucleotidyltransferase family protein [Bacteroidales bacterium]
MKNPTVNSQQQIEVMLELLRSAVLDRAPVIDPDVKVDWDALFDNSLSHEVMAWLWDGICCLPANVMPPRQVRIGWSLSAQEVWAEYEKQTQVLRSLLDLASKNNTRILLLKGHSLAALYPKPCSRTCGDIDIFPLDNYQLINDLLVQHVVDEKGKHATIMFNGVMVENHNNFLEPNTAQKRRIINYLHSTLDQVTLSSEGYYLLPPTANLVFLLFHTMKHFQESKVMPLRNVIDFAMCLHSNETVVDRIEIRKLLERFNLQKPFAMLCYMSEAILGIPFLDFVSFQLPASDCRCFDVFVFESLNRSSTNENADNNGISFDHASQVVAQYIPDNYPKWLLIKRFIRRYLKL